MRMRKLATMVCGILGIVLMTTATSQAATHPPASPATGTCHITAWGHAVPVVCRAGAYLNADWTGDDIRDEVFFISPPNNYIYRISSRSNGPVRVSNGVAWTMVRTEIRASGTHRVYAATAGGTQIYAQEEGPIWTSWYPYVP